MFNFYQKILTAKKGRGHLLKNSTSESSANGFYRFASTKNIHHLGEINIPNNCPKYSQGQKRSGPPRFSPRAGTLIFLQTLVEPYRIYFRSQTFFSDGHRFFHE